MRVSAIRILSVATAIFVALAMLIAGVFTLMLLYHLRIASDGDSSSLRLDILLGNTYFFVSWHAIILAFALLYIASIVLAWLFLRLRNRQA